MEARARQQAKYDQAAKELEEKMKNEPPPKVGPISKQIADQAKVKANLRPGNFFELIMMFHDERFLGLFSKIFEKNRQHYFTF